MIVKKNSFKAWILASRPSSLSGASMPVFVASALAFRDNKFQWLPALICLAFALLAQIVANLANDYFDFKSGADNAERVGPKRAVLEGWVTPKAMLTVSLVLLAIDLLIGLSLVYFGGWWLIVVGAAVALCAFTYTAGPYPLAYHGFGGICVFVFFGIVPVGFSYYVQALNWTLPVTLCGIALGLVIINMLVANNYRDRFTDEKVGKRTSVVILGEKFGRYFYLFNGIIAVICCQYFWIEKSFFAAGLPLIYLVIHILTWKKIKKMSLLNMSARNILIFGTLLTIGILIDIL